MTQKQSGCEYKFVAIFLQCRNNISDTSDPTEDYENTRDSGNTCRTDIIFVSRYFAMNDCQPTDETRNGNNSKQNKSNDFKKRLDELWEDLKKESATNSGKSIATHIKGTFTISRINLGNRRIIGEAKRSIIDIHQIKADSGRGDNYGIRTLDSEFASKDSVISLRETVRVEGDVTFWDGFAEVSIPICK